jgi:UPF0042 nucleotide-binding protein
MNKNEGMIENENEGKEKSDSQPLLHEKIPDLVIVTGMSGAGRTEVIHTLEDLGYYCVDNLPARLFKNLLDIEGMPTATRAKRKLAVVCDTRNREFFSGFIDELNALDEQKLNYRLLFLDARDEKLIARYKSSRRRHPLCASGMTISQGVQKERSLLASVRSMAHDVLDTSDLLPQQLRAKLRELFAEGKDFEALAVTVYSFGFKHGGPYDADLVMDVRFLPNPYWDPKLKALTGLDEAVRNFVLYRTETEEFQKTFFALLDCVMPGYVKEGKQQLAIGIGCTGGQHRSVVLAETTGNYLKAQGYRVSIAHRDLTLAIAKYAAK